jgi:uncharacterized protein YwgA
MSGHLNKFNSLLYTIQKFGSVPGKKALHKIIYFANLRAETYAFQWHKYGPYSEELNYILDDAIMEGLVDVAPTDLLVRNGQQLNMKLSNIGLDILKSSHSMNASVKKSVNFAYDILKEKNPRQMELLASTHYILTQSNDQMNAKSIWDVLITLKPHSGYTQDDVAMAIKELKNLMLI